jgi:hypothetical protein
MGVGGQRHAPAALPPGKTRYPMYMRLDGPQGRSGRVWKISPQPGFDPRTVQPVASRYTDYATPAHMLETEVCVTTELRFRIPAFSLQDFITFSPDPKLVLPPSSCAHLSHCYTNGSGPVVGG